MKKGANMADEIDKIWKIFLKRHWKMFTLFIIACIIAIASAIYVFIWFVGDAQATGLVPATLDLWTVGYVITFLLHMIFWELIIIGIPSIIVAAAVYFLWWKKLPADERMEYRRGHLFGKRSHRMDGGGGISFGINLGFIIKVYLDGNWNTPFAEWTFDYLVFSYLHVLLVFAAVIGIPLAIGLTFWLRHEIKKEP
jgi:hypothetical protein